MGVIEAAWRAREAQRQSEITAMKAKYAALEQQTRELLMATQERERALLAAEAELRLRKAGLEREAAGRMTEAEAAVRRLQVRLLCSRDCGTDCGSPCKLAHERHAGWCHQHVHCTPVSHALCPAHIVMRHAELKDACLRWTGCEICVLCMLRLLCLQVECEHQLGIERERTAAAVQQRDAAEARTAALEAQFTQYVAAQRNAPESQLKADLAEAQQAVKSGEAKLQAALKLKQKYKQQVRTRLFVRSGDDVEGWTGL